jgi:hypothetical protein
MLCETLNTNIKTDHQKSTVSKVLRKKEQYLNHAPPKETPRSPPTKRAKARLPDIEKTLSAWILKEQKKGSFITDDAIREQAYYFASIPGPDTATLNPVNIPGWLEKFKQKHHVNGIGIKSSGNIRKDSVAATTDYDNKTPTSPSDDPASSSPDTVFPATLGTTIDAKPILTNKRNRRKSPPSIDTAITSLGNASTCFSPSLLASPTSPFFSSSTSQISSTGGLHSPFLTQNFRALDTFMVDSPPEDEERGFFEGQMAEAKERLGSIDECMEDISLLPSGVAPTGERDIDTVDPSTLGGVGLGLDSTTTDPKVTEEEARKALSVLVEYFKGQPRGSLDVAEGMLLGRLKEKLLR